MLLRISVAVVLSSLLVVCLGCGPSASEVPLGEVSGKVSHKNQPLNTGTITFVHELGRPYAADIANGAYKLKAGVGKCKVTIVSRESGPPIKDKPGMTTPGKSLIPEKYENPDRSGLTFDVKAGENKKDFDLAD